nr:MULTISPECIES: nuclear transport factor 2 family protein [unclassified Bradyrhizobium]
MDARVTLVLAIRRRRIALPAHDAESAKAVASSTPAPGHSTGRSFGHHWTALRALLTETGTASPSGPADRTHPACRPDVPEMPMTDRSTHDFTTFMTQREAAARAYVGGDAAPLAQLAATTDPVSFFGPSGGHLTGATAVTSAYQAGAAMFAGDGRTHLEILQQGASGTLAFWTGIQRATVRLHGKTDAMPMDLRVTEIFRREDGAWKLVHRHADTLVVAQAR